MDDLNFSYEAPPLKEGEDYYLDPKGYRVMTADYHRRRGYCCGNGCRHCPYFPQYLKGNRHLKE